MRLAPAALLLVLLLGCGGKSGTPVPPSPPADASSGELGAPSAYRASRSTALNLLRGGAFAAGSARNIQPSDLDAVFDPQLPQPLPDADRLARAVYVLRPDSTAHPQLHLWAGAAPPAEAGLTNDVIKQPEYD